jgi:O-antigen/teichoic acid export membrane protein
MVDKPAASFGKDIVSVFSSNILTLIANLTVVILLTRKLGPEGYGLYTAVLVVPLLVVSFFQMGIRPTTVFMIGSKSYDIHQVVSGVISALLFTSSAGIIFSAIAYIAMFKAGYTFLLISLALLTIPMRLTTIYAGGVFLAKEEMRKANRMNWVTALLNLLTAVLLVWILNTGVVGALISMMMSNLVVAVYAIWLLYKEYNITISFRNPLIIQMLKTGVVFALSFLIIQMNFRVDILFLQIMTDETEVGLYSLGVAVAELLWQIPLAIGIVVMTRSANTKDTKQMNENTARLLRLSLAAGIILSALIFILAPIIIPLVFGDKYLLSIAIIQTILPGIIIMIIFRILSGQLSGMGKPEVALKAFIPALILNVIFNFIFIPLWGGLGAAFASNISYAVGTVLYLLYYSKITDTKTRDLFIFQKADVQVLKSYLSSVIKN